MTDNNKWIDDSIPSGQVPARLLDLYRQQGAGWYSGEEVTQTEHALQAAWLAEQAECPQALVTAALLHDIGHLLHELGEDCALEGLDDEHEQVAAVYLSSWFPESVTEPIRLHVPAKRYRCGSDAAYHAELSPASQLSLQLQEDHSTRPNAASFCGNHMPRPPCSSATSTTRPRSSDCRHQNWNTSRVLWKSACSRKTTDRWTTTSPTCC